MRNIHVCGNPFQCTHITNNGNSNHQFEQCCSLRSSPTPSSASGRRCWNRTPQPRWDDMNVRVNPTIDICDPWGGGVDVHGQRRSGSRVFCSTSASAANVCDHPHHDDEMLIVPPQHSSISVIDLNWLETPSAHILKADVPGLRKEDLSILIEGEVVKIRGQRTLEYFSNCLNKQLTWYIPFRRQFVLPPNVIAEDIRAVLDHGVLTITVPKIPIVPSIAWFIPVDRSASPPRELQPNSFINIQYEREPNLSSSFNECPSTPRLRVCPVSPRARSLSESNVSFIYQDDPTSSRSASSPSTPKIQNVIVKRPPTLAAVLCEEEEASSSQQQHTIDIPGPSSSPKSLSIVQEDGKKPNAHVTLNININTGKIVGGESNSNRSGGIGGASIDHDLGDEDFGRNFRDSGTGNNSSFSSSPAPSRSNSALRQRPSRVQFDDDFGNDRQRYSSQFDFPSPSGPRGSRRLSRSSSVDPGDEDLDSEGFEVAPRDRYLEQAADEENAPDSSTSTPGRSRPSVSRSRMASVQQPQQQDDDEVDVPPPPSPPQRKSIRGQAEESAEDDGQSSPAPRKRSSASSSPPKEERFKGRAISRRMTTGDIDESGTPEPQLPRRKTEGDSPSNREPLQAARGSRKLSEAPTVLNRRKSKAEAPVNEETDGRKGSAKPVEEDASKSAPSASRKNSRRPSQASPPSRESEALTRKEKEVLKKRSSLPLQPRRKSSAGGGQGGPNANEKKRNSSSAGAGAKRSSASRRASEAQEEAGEITNRRSFEKRKSKRPDDDMGP